MNEYDKILDLATSEARKFLREVETIEMRDNVRFLRMALHLLEKELDEELKKRTGGAGLGEIIESQAEAKQETTQERADTHTRRCVKENA